jgi:hypothetical protein
LILFFIRGVIKEPATALQVTGEEGNIEAIEYFTNRYASMSRANIKESKNKSEVNILLALSQYKT